MRVDWDCFGHFGLLCTHVEKVGLGNKIRVMCLDDEETYNESKIQQWT